LLRPGSAASLSVISVWEIASKCASGKLALDLPPRDFVRRGTIDLRLETLPLTAEAAYAGAELPPIHKDPFDRLLIGQAIVHGLTVVTPDAAFRRYGVSTLW